MKMLSVFRFTFIMACVVLNGNLMKSQVCVIDESRYDIYSESDLNNFIEEYGACDSLVGTIYINADIDFKKLDFIKSLQRLRIDNFNADYPVFNQLVHLNILIFYTSKISELKGFNAIRNDSLDISIHDNGVLTEVNGFNALDSIHRLWIDNQLTSLTFKGFENITCIQTIDCASDVLLNLEAKIDLRVFDKVKRLEHLNLTNFRNPDKVIIPSNINLIDLVGIQDTNAEGEISLFNNVDSIGGFHFGVNYSEDLISGQGYKDLDFISHVVFYNGTFLPGGLTSITDRFSISNNKELSRCHVPSLCDYLASDDPDIRIYGNASGCFRQSEVEAACAAIQACTIDIDGRNDITLRTQTEVDDFISQYGLCERVYGDVHIVSDHDLSGFNHLKALGRLKISGMEGTELVGFDSLRQLRRLELFENHNLERLSTFEMLESITEDLEFHRNESLTSIDGFQNLSEVGSLLINVYGGTDLSGFQSIRNIHDELMIFNNPELESLNGLDSLQHITNKISIHNNGDLVDLSALGNLELFIDHLTISANPNLAICEIDPICDFLSTRTEDVFVNITNNLSGCNSEIEVLNACGIVAVDDLYHDIISLYPNPTDHKIYIESDVEIIRYSIYDLHGRILKDSPLHSAMIDLSELNNGVYILTLTSEDQQLITRKIIKR